MKNIDKQFIIKIVGIGDCGINIVEHISHIPNPNTYCIDIDTNWPFLDKYSNKFVKIGEKLTKGMGTGAHLDIGRKAAEENKQDIINCIKDSHILIIVAGLGGGTGSGATPVVSTLAQDLNIPTLAFVTLPLNIESKLICKNAENCVQELKKIVDCLFVISNEKLFTSYMKNNNKNISLSNIFEETNNNVKKYILETIQYINLQIKDGYEIQHIIKKLKCKNLILL